MRGPIRDIIIHLLGYVASDVDIDAAGEGGRPDVTARVPSGLQDAKGRATKIDWIVVEAKDEHRCFVDTTSRESIFEKKSKYVGADTAWFVMVEPCAWIIRPVAGNDLTPNADISIPLNGITEPEFKGLTEALHADKAGVSAQLMKFREGDLRMIAVEKLSVQNGPTSSKMVLNRIMLNRRRFFQQVREATAHLQGALVAHLPGLIQKYKRIGNWPKYFGLNSGEMGKLLTRIRSLFTASHKGQNKAVSMIGNRHA